MNRVVVSILGKDIELGKEEVKKLEEIKKTFGGDYKTAIKLSILLTHVLIGSNSVTTSSNV